MESKRGERFDTTVYKRTVPQPDIASKFQWDPICIWDSPDRNGASMILLNVKYVNLYV